MNNAINTLKKVGICPADILIPNSQVDAKKWAIVACDQYTSQPEYWKSVTDYVKDAPSTLHLIYPEVYLEEKSPQERIKSINSTMSKYLQNNIFTSYPSTFVLVERKIKNATRWGLMVALDLELYDYAKDSRTPIRATEGTIESRIPPRKLIRKDAPLELPHILVLISDENKSIIEPFANNTDSLQKVYETDLMKDGGHLKGYAINKSEHMEQLATHFTALFEKADKENPLVYAMGDGNHSLATARSCWLDIKKELPMSELEDHPARYALVEIENIYDEGLTFEAIHRVLFNTPRDLFIQTLSNYCDELDIECVSSIEEMMEVIEEQTDVQKFGYNDKDGYYVVTLTAPHFAIAAGTLQSVIDELLEKKIKGLSVDYIHGIEVTAQLGENEGNIGLFLPSIDKHTFFDVIVADGALPRKTFSMGEAHEKRFYMEARKIK